MAEKETTFDGDTCVEKDAHSNSFKVYERSQTKRDATNAARATGEATEEAADEAIKIEEGESGLRHPVSLAWNAPNMLLYCISPIEDMKTPNVPVFCIRINC